MPTTTVTPKTLRMIVLGLFLVVVLGLTLFQLRFLLGGAEIVFDQDYYEVSQPWFDMVFMVENTKEVTVQGVSVIPQINGLVEKRIYLAPGINTLEITAKDPYGSTSIKKIRILYPQEGKKPDFSPVI